MQQDASRIETNISIRYLRITRRGVCDVTQAALRDLGMLDGKKPEEIPDAMLSYMRMADAAAASRGEGIGFDAFSKFYETLVMAKARQQLRFKLGLQVEGGLRDDIHSVELS